MRLRQVVVIGSSDETGFHEEARAIGAFIASRDFVLITGGRGGIMESVSRGAAELGVDLDGHIQFVIDAMAGIAEQLGLTPAQPAN